MAVLNIISKVYYFQNNRYVSTLRYFQEIRTTVRIPLSNLSLTERHHGSLVRGLPLGLFRVKQPKLLSSHAIKPFFNLTKNTEPMHTRFLKND